MPAFRSSTRHRRIFFDTRFVEAGQEVNFFGKGSAKSDVSISNMAEDGVLPQHETATVFAIGMRVIGARRDDEDALLDHLTVNLVVCGKLGHEIPAADCGHKGRSDPAGFVLSPCVPIPTRAMFHLRVTRGHFNIEAGIYVRASLGVFHTVPDSGWPR